MTDSPQIVSTDSTDVAMISGNKSVVIEDFLNSATVIGSQATDQNQHPSMCALFKFNIAFKQRDILSSPMHNVPFRRDLDFIDRGKLLDQIQDKCSAPASRVALVGPGGVGKSQLAIEYCYRIRDQSPETWIFWVHAGNAARIEQGYRDIAEQVNISSRNDPKGNIFELVDDWLRNEKKEKWALILDNADDALLFETHTSSHTMQANDGSSDGLTQPLSAYLPQSENGWILVTTQNESVALNLVEESEIIPIEPMNDFDALALVEKKLGEKIGKSDAVELVKALDFMPLAIIQSAAYIRQRGSDFSIRDYLTEFYKYNTPKTSFLNRESRHLRNQEAENSIITTAQISFDHIHQARTSATDLLSFMSFFDRQGIPETLVKAYKKAENTSQRRNSGNVEDVKNGKDSIDDKNDGRQNDRNENTVPDSSVDDEFETDILTLRNYSLITISFDSTNFQMRRLVQLAVQKCLEASDQLEKWKQQFIKSLCAAFPTGNYKNWTKCQIIFPHVKAAEAQQPVLEDSLREWAVLIIRAAYYLETKGTSAEAETMALKGLETLQRIRGQEYEETLVGMHNLSLIYNSRGKWKDAEKLLNELIDLKTKVYGAEHVETASSIFALASTYRKQGQWNEAEALQVQVMNIYKKDLGPEHSHTLHSMNNLAMTYLDQGRWKEAETLQMQVMNTHAASRGIEHPFTLTSMNNLALNYSKQGRWKEAETLQVGVMNTQTKVLGGEHPNSLITMNNLAWTYRNQKNFNEAEALQMKVLSAETKLLGNEHPSTLITMNNLALTYMDQQRWEQAEAIQTHVLNTHKRVLGPEHPHTLVSMNRLALTYWNQYRLNEAETLQTQVLAMRKRMLGTEEHPDVLISMNNLAHTYKVQGRVREAIDLLKECNGLQMRILGPTHPQTRDSRKDLDEWLVESETLES